MFQGRPGDKGQKGELGSPGFDVFAAVKVRLKRFELEFFLFLYDKSQWESAVSRFNNYNVS